MGKNLATRVGERATNGAPARTLDQQIGAMRDQLALAMPRGMEASQLVRDALTALRRVPKLGECEPMSVMGALMTCAQLGLRPNTPLGHGWILPFWNTKQKRYDAQLIIGYQGYAELAHRSGQISTVIARAVHESDHFELDYGVADNIVHKPFMHGDRGPVTGFYAIVKYVSGGYAFYYMSRSDVEAHRDRFAMTRNRQGQIFGPWVDHFDAMALKTVFRMLVKWMPKSTELAAAEAADETVRVDLSPDQDALMGGEHPVLDGEMMPDDAAPAETKPDETDAKSGETATPAAPPETEQDGGDDAERDLVTTLGPKPEGGATGAIVAENANGEQVVITRVEHGDVTDPAPEPEQDNTPPEDTVAAARTALKARAKKMGLDDADVTVAYSRLTGTALRLEKNPAAIREFITRLENDREGTMGTADLSDGGAEG